MNSEQILIDFEKSLDVSGEFLRTKWEENSSIEFKKSLHTRSEEVDKSYLTTISGLANNKGGMILFGIENKTRELVGIKPEYENLDNRYFASPIRLGLDGSLDYFFFTGKFLNKVVGFLYVSEAQSKPVIMKVNAEGVVRGEIYFRYSAQTTKIEAADLRRILEEEVNRKLDKTLKAMQKVADIGADRLALLNTESGQVDLINNDNIKAVLSYEALKGLNIIKKGKIVDEEGAAAYTIRGELEIELEDGNDLIEKHILTLTKETEIYESFFSGVCEHPVLMLQQLLYHRGQYSPLYFFINKADLSLTQAKQLLESIDDRNVIPATKDRILERLEKSEYTKQGAIIEEVKHCFTSSEDVYQLINQVKTVLSSGSKNTEQKIARTICLNTLRSKQYLPEEIYKVHSKRAIEAISHLDESFIQNNKTLIINELEHIYNVVRNADVNSIMRKVICNVDKALYETKPELAPIPLETIVP
ncbi:ATP-binding protein [Hymenobacter chitinivorans]|uniref:Putative DNA-binding protein n=1 Tax=Hymenobacter chitinivorans DSM 11115 TaxID=1121954 RepID=A0A2M9B5M5_9BACT|nr:ATP-binding protein [Hymenobacter chitinivorans]PJJ53246.1 putative DNA-binding protein [Hymenobacter chitinivorans DSM 11115]